MNSNARQTDSLPVPGADALAQSEALTDLIRGRIAAAGGWLPFDRYMDLALYAPFASAAVKLRIDLIDNLTLGSTPVLSPGTGNAPTPATTPGQLPNTLFRLKRAYGEILTPVGYFAAGRMGNMWGLGIMANGGDCLDCNLGDAADRVRQYRSGLV